MRLSAVLGFSTLVSTLLLSGCSSFQTTAPASASQGAAVQGRVHGGRQAIVGAHVYLMAAGTSGYGGAAVSLLDGIATGQSDSIGAYVLTDSQGGFSISGDYSCTSTQQVYLLAVGGDAGSGENSASSLMAVLGQCPSSSTNFAAALPFISVNEVTTVAGAYALSGFMTDMLHVSSSGTALANMGMANAFLTAANLADISSGSANATTPAGNGTAPQAKLNTLANILAACINTDGTVSSGPTPTGCYTLFANATSDGTANGTQPTETVTAAVNMAHWSGINVANLFALAPSIAPFQPTVSTMSSMSLATVFTGGGLLSPAAIAVDGSGNIWTVNGAQFSSNAISADSSVSKFAAGTGAALSPTTTGYTGGGLYIASSLAIDISNNVWIGNQSSITWIGNGYTSSGTPDAHLTKLAADGTPVSATGYNLNSVGTSGPIMIDGSGEVYAGTGSNYISKVDGTTGTVSQLMEIMPVNLSGGLGAISSDAITPNGDLVLGTSIAPGVAEIDPTGALILPANGIYTGTYPSGVQSPLSMAIDHAGNVWATNGFTQYSDSGVAEFSSAGVLLSLGNIGFASYFNYPSALAVDGLGRVFVLSGYGSITELNNNGSPAQDLVPFVNEGFNTGSALGYGSGLAIDGSGNLWVANSRTSTLTEFVGGATPVVTPIAAGVANNTLGTQP